MARGRKKKPKDAVAAIDQKIEDLKKEISDLKKRRKAAVARADEAEKQKVVNAFIASGKSAEDFLLDIINSQ